jgi:hypothetical protein
MKEIIKWRRITDRSGQVFETITDKAMNNATTVSETNLNWKWTTERPALNFKNSVSALAASASTSLVWTTSSWLRNRVSLEQFQERMSYGLFVSELVEEP